MADSLVYLRCVPVRSSNCFCWGLQLGAVGAGCGKDAVLIELLTVVGGTAAFERVRGCVVGAGAILILLVGGPARCYAGLRLLSGWGCGV